jgi:pimeloyl-ACP methyl ester carboxylesterase
VRRPPTLILWGPRDPFVTPQGGDAYQRALPDAELIEPDSGHFVVEAGLDAVAGAIRRLHAERVAAPAGGR